jgi:hypothetical protein
VGSKRLIQRAYAKVHGFFWLPCPVCGREFGGHEWADVDGLPSMVPDDRDPALSHGICPDCTMQGYGYPHRWFERGEFHV